MFKIQGFSPFAMVLFIFFYSFPGMAQIRIGSKTFTESYILGEILAQLLEEQHIVVDRKLGMGGTGILFHALQEGEIDMYVEYTGTIAEAILKQPHIKTFSKLRAELRKHHLMTSEPLGFNNTYALAMRMEMANQLNIKKISDLKNHLHLRYGMSYEFLRRADGFVPLKKRYGLKAKDVQGMEHNLAYEALRTKAIDVLDVYTTDGKIAPLNLYVLEDDLQFFPKYEAVLLVRENFITKNPTIWESLRSLEGQISASDMIQLNSDVEIEKRSFQSVAAQWLKKENHGYEEKQASLKIQWKALVRRTQEHLILVFVSLFISILVGIPLGFVATRSPWLAQFILAFSGMVQTIPSLALLGFLIPLIGIGLYPSLVALCLYSLLPIVRNTYLGLTSIDRLHLEVMNVLGLKKWHRLVYIELPLASPSILAGVKISSVMAVGTATLAAFIGAGGYGNFILSGIAINDSLTILHGAVPSALLAMILQFFFEISEKLFIPKGLRLSKRNF